MSNQNEDQPEVMPVDEPPKSGTFIDQEQFYKELTPEEIAEGEFIGAETPDVDFIEHEPGVRTYISDDSEGT